MSTLQIFSELFHINSRDKAERGKQNEWKLHSYFKGQSHPRRAVPSTRPHDSGSVITEDERGTLERQVAESGVVCLANKLTHFDGDEPALVSGRQIVNHMKVYSLQRGRRRSRLNG